MPNLDDQHPWTAATARAASGLPTSSSPSGRPAGGVGRLAKTAVQIALLWLTSTLAFPMQADDLKLGAPAPPLTLTTLDGRNIATNDLHGQVVIVTFWATWCEPCREELPLLSAYAAKHAAQGLQVLGFSLDGADQLPKVRSVAADLHFPVGLLGGAWAGGYGRVWRLPVTFVINREGRLIHNGWDDEDPVWTQARLHQVVDPLLAESK